MKNSAKTSKGTVILKTVNESSKISYFLIIPIGKDKHERSSRECCFPKLNGCGQTLK